MTEDEMVRQCHQSYQNEFDPTPGGSGRQEGLACSGPRGHNESDTTTKQQQCKHLLPFVSFSKYTLCPQSPTDLPAL